MSYQKHIWKSNELPALNGMNLNHIEDGIEAAHDNFTNYKLKGDFAVVTGTIECTNSTDYTNKNIDYPTGFNKDNCAVISFGLGGQSFNFGYSGLAYGYSYTSPQTGLLSGSQDRNVILCDDYISISCYNPSNNTSTYTYQIVLMKLQEEEDNE